jgi:hypothetical protein
VAVVTTKYYRVARHASSGRYVATGAVFASAGMTNGDVTLVQSGTSTLLGSLRNGTFQFGSATPAYPSDSFNATDYFVDLGFVPNTSVLSGGRLQTGVAPRATGSKRIGAAAVLRAGATLSAEAIATYPVSDVTYRRPGQFGYARAEQVTARKPDILDYRRN